MLNAALIEKCVDPSLMPAIVEQFVETAGSLDPLDITLKSGGLLILVPKAKNPDEAMDIIRENVVRVGLMQFFVGVDVATGDRFALRHGVSAGLAFYSSNHDRFRPLIDLVIHASIQP